MDDKRYRSLMAEVIGTRMWVCILGVMLLPKGGFGFYFCLLMAVIAFVQAFPYWFVVGKDGDEA